MSSVFCGEGCNSCVWVEVTSWMNGRRDTTKASSFVFMSLKEESKSPMRSSYIERVPFQLSCSPTILVSKSNRHLPPTLRSLLKGK